MNKNLADLPELLARDFMRRMVLMYSITAMALSGTVVSLCIVMGWVTSLPIAMALFFGGALFLFIRDAWLSVYQAKVGSAHLSIIKRSITQRKEQEHKNA